jgi:tetratricopeptide (TPR) repeat protein
MTTIIRIEEQPTTDQPYTAHVSFNHSVRYPCQVRDPFADQPQQEADLEWYFEEYLTFPFTNAVRARDAAKSIRNYGKTLFDGIFHDPQALLQYRQATLDAGLHTIQLEIAGSSSFHRLHWEALNDPVLGIVALHAPIIRQNLTPQTFPSTMQPSTTINILVVVARPAGSRDVGYRTISRPLVEELAKMKQPVSVTLLRPGTYQALKTHLEKVTRERGVGYYHVIHFDVHGGLLTYDEFQQVAAPNRYIYKGGRSGREDIASYTGEKAYLILESERSESADLDKRADPPDPVEASEMAQLLLMYRIPIAILNACQSGKYIGKDETSLGSRLIEAGVQTVLAMGYSVTVSAAELLMPVLYRELLKEDSGLSSALCLARQELADRKQRRAFFNQQIELEDWVLPIVYQNQDVRFAVQQMTPQQKTAFLQQQVQQYRPPQQPGYGFVGRDVDILHEDLPFDRLYEVVQEAVKWGLLSPDPDNLQFLHLQPVLPYFLRNRFSGDGQQQRRIAVEKAFQDHYRDISQSLDALITSKEAKEQQIGLIVTRYEYENLLSALHLAMREKASIIDIYNLLDAYLNRQQDHQRGQEIDVQVVQFFETLSAEELSDLLEKESLSAFILVSNRQVMLKQYEMATKSYQKILQMLEVIEYDTKYRRLTQASIYYNLGQVAERQRKWEEAERNYQEALQICVEYNNRYEQASTYHNLGVVAQEQRKWEEAERNYREALQICVEYNARYEQARTYHNLGAIAQEQRKWEEAERNYREALQIKVEYNDRYEQAKTYHQLGRVAQEQGKWEEARELFLQSFSIYLEYGDTYNGNIALNRLAHLWQASNDESILERVVSVLGGSREEVEELLREFLKHQES